MNVTINRAEMLSAIKRASAVAPADSPLDVLRGVLLEADAAAGKLTVTSTNLEAALEEKLPCAVQEDGALVFGAKMLAEMLSRLPQDTVVLWDVRMTSAELKHRAELQEWAAQIQECRSSGLSVSEWCRQQGVTTTLLASFSGIPLSFAEAQILPSKKTVKMLRSGLKK